MRSTPVDSSPSEYTAKCGIAQSHCWLLFYFFHCVSYHKHITLIIIAMIRYTWKPFSNFAAAPVGCPASVVVAVEDPVPVEGVSPHPPIPLQMNEPTPLPPLSPESVNDTTAVLCSAPGASKIASVCTVPPDDAKVRCTGMLLTVTVAPPSTPTPSGVSVWLPITTTGNVVGDKTSPPLLSVTACDRTAM